MSCEVCPGPEGREVSKVVGARNMSECGGKPPRSAGKCIIEVCYKTWTMLPKKLLILKMYCASGLSLIFESG